MPHCLVGPTPRVFITGTDPEARVRDSEKSGASLRGQEQRGGERSEPSALVVGDDLYSGVKSSGESTYLPDF